MTKNFRFNLSETAGALGDYGTLLPLVVGVAAVTEANLSHILFFFALSYLATGIYYQLPVPVEPMKAIGVAALAGTLTVGEIAGAGIITGVILLIVAITGSIHYIKKAVPTCVVRGIQVGLALTLMREAFDFVISDWQLGLLSLGLVLVFSLAPLLDISALMVLALGVGVGVYYHGLPSLTILSWPGVVIPSAGELWSGFWHGSLPQVPLTLGNAVLATSLIIKDLFEKDVPEKKLLMSMSFMCLVASPLGGFPMCHGAGGLAAQYRFGARTGGSNIISGVILLGVALFFASPELLNIIPYGALGALLFFSGVELMKSAIKTDHALITVVTGGMAFWWGLPEAFGLMLAYYWSAKYLESARYFRNC